MKKRKLLLIIALATFSTMSIAQELIISNGDGFIQYDSKEKKILPLDESKVISRANPQTPIYVDQLAYYTDQISDRLQNKENFEFFQGLQSPFDSNLWIYMERQEIGGSYSITSFDTKKNKGSVLLNVKNNSGEKMVYKPIAWTSKPDEVYVEGLYLDSAEEHEGIFIFNIKDKKISKINIPFQYMRTPILSQDRTTFYFAGTQDEIINILHGNTDIIYEFDMISNKVAVIYEKKGDLLIINGWKDDIITNSTTRNQARVSTLDYYLPWDLNKELCVSRHGTPAPSGLNNNVGVCNRFRPGGQHGYAAIDFATSKTSNDYVRAAASGKVSFVGLSGTLTSGYGRLVIITHSDGTRTYYAHNSSLLVIKGENVSQGQVIAREGTTGGSTGDHIHFEWRAAGGNSPTIGSFKNIGQPRVDNRYRSNNSTVVNNTPVAVSPVNGATNLLLPINFKYTSPVNATNFRIQVSTSNTGWTATNGFTTSTVPNATIIVNAGIPDTNYYWNETAAGSLEGPKAGKTYYYTVRSWDAVSGTSKYSAVRTVSTQFGVQPIAPGNAVTVTSPAKLSWTSSISGATYRLQISKVKTGWTAENGFTTDTNPTSSVPVNYSIANLLNYNWPNQYTEPANLPISGNTYYWTVRLWSAASGVSKYTPIRSFTINGNNARFAAANDDLLVYPNPSNGALNLSFEATATNVEIAIYDLSGNVVFSKNYNNQSGKSTISENISELSNGNYILLVNDGEKVISKTISVNK